MAIPDFQIAGDTLRIWRFPPRVTLREQLISREVSEGWGLFMLNPTYIFWRSVQKSFQAEVLEQGANIIEQKGTAVCPKNLYRKMKTSFNLGNLPFMC